jgi:hypothetical protein
MQSCPHLDEAQKKASEKKLRSLIGSWGKCISANYAVRKKWVEARARMRNGQGTVALRSDTNQPTNTQERASEDPMMAGLDVGPGFDNEGGKSVKLRANVRYPLTELVGIMGFSMTRALREGWVIRVSRTANGVAGRMAPQKRLCVSFTISCPTEEEIYDLACFNPGLDDEVRGSLVRQVLLMTEMSYMQISGKDSEDEKVGNIRSQRAAECDSIHGALIQILHLQQAWINLGWIKLTAGDMRISQILQTVDKHGLWDNVFQYYKWFFGRKKGRVRAHELSIKNDTDLKAYLTPEDFD